MTTTTAPSITLEEFLQLPFINESPAWEFINGERSQKSMGGGKHSTIQKRLVGLIDQTDSVYEAFPELRCTVAGRSIVPDVSVFQRDDLPVDEDGEIIATGVTFAPVWIIEVLSPQQSQTRVTGNILHCLDHGSRLGWLIDPDERSVITFQPNCLPQILSENAKLPVLPDLDLALTPGQIFQWLQRQRRG